MLELHPEFDALQREVRHGFGYVHARLDSMDIRLLEHSTQLAQLRDDLKTQGEEIRAEMKTQGEEIRAEMKTQGEEIRAEMQSQITGLFNAFERSFEILKAQLEQQLNTKFEQLNANFEKINARLDSHFGPGT